MKSRPLLSVIVPVYNGAEHVAAALESVCRQAYEPLEIIVVDDGSTDDTAEEVASFRETRWPALRYVYQPNAGPAAARNRGFEMARGEWIAFLDADDVWVDGGLAALAEPLQAPDVQLVVGCTQRVRAAKEPGGAGRLLPFGPVWLTFTLSAAIFRRQCFEQVGMFDATLRYGEDVDWFLRAREAGVAIEVRDRVVVWHRQHESNMTLDTDQSNHYFLAALRKSLQRRRGGRGPAPELPPVPALEGRTLADFQQTRSDASSGPGTRRSKRHG